jgi:hypothetical protein
MAQKKAQAGGAASQLKVNAAAMTIKCVTCFQQFMNTTRAAESVMSLFAGSIEVKLILYERD